MKPHRRFEKQAQIRGFNKIAGVDEAGRGPLAGPVVAAACVLPKTLHSSLKEINDSKNLNPLQRYALYEKIITHPGIEFGIGVVDSLKIDQINILQASFEAMIIAIQALSAKTSPPDFVLIDGPYAPKQLTIQSWPIISGDAQSLSIAAASIIAKETRDRIMIAYHSQWPVYGFDKHKGYGTAQHLEAIALHGLCPIHRTTYEPCQPFIKIFNN